MTSSVSVLLGRRLTASPPVVRGVAAFLALHGVAHFEGTSDAFTKAADGRSVEYLAGAWTVADLSVLRVFGVVWALTQPRLPRGGHRDVDAAPRMGTRAGGGVAAVARRGRGRAVGLGGRRRHRRRAG